MVNGYNDVRKALRKEGYVMVREPPRMDEMTQALKIMHLSGETETVVNAVGGNVCVVGDCKKIVLDKVAMIVTDPYPGVTDIFGGSVPLTVTVLSKPKTSRKKINEVFDSIIGKVSSDYKEPVGPKSGAYGGNT